VSRKRVIRLMQEDDLVARRRQRFKCTTMSDHHHPVAANVLTQADRLLWVWLSRIRTERTLGGTAARPSHVHQTIAADFFVVPTATGRLSFVLVLFAHQRRRAAHVAVTTHPTAAWTAQQLREAFPRTTRRLSDSRSRSRLRSRPYHSGRDGHHRSAHRTAVALPKRRDRTVYRIGTARPTLVNPRSSFQQRHRLAAALWQTQFDSHRIAPLSGEQRPRCSAPERAHRRSQRFHSLRDGHAVDGNDFPSRFRTTDDEDPCRRTHPPASREDRSRRSVYTRRPASPRRRVIGRFVWNPGCVTGVQGTFVRRVSRNDVRKTHMLSVYHVTHGVHSHGAAR
jgi:hypothetical protein